jgi:hypothetical protein
MPRRSIVPGSGTTLISTAFSRVLVADQVPPLSVDKRNVSNWKPPEPVGVLPTLRPHLICPASEATTSAYCVLAAREKKLESKKRVEPLRGLHVHRDQARREELRRGVAP